MFLSLPLTSILALAVVYSVATAADAKPIWQDLIVADCNGGMHVLPSTPVGISTNTYQQIKLAEVVRNALHDVTQCAGADEATKSCDLEDLLSRFIPGIDMLNANMFGFEDAPDPLGDAGTKGAMFNFFSSGMPIYKLLGYDVKHLLMGIVPMSSGDLRSISIKKLFSEAGITCSPSAYAAGEPCRLQVDLMASIGIKLGVHWQKCGTDAAHAGKVFASLHCLGDMCKTYLKPCTSTSSCGPGAHCNLVSITAKDITSTLAEMGLIKRDGEEEAELATATQLEQCIKDASEKSVPFAWRVVSRVRQWADGFFGTKSAPSASFGYCLPDLMKEGFDKVGDNLADLGQKFNASQIDLMQTSDKVKECTKSGCRIADVGNEICDANCNNRNCFFDGGDCAGPEARKVTSQMVTSEPGLVGYGYNGRNRYYYYRPASPSNVYDGNWVDYAASKNVDVKANQGFCVRRLRQDVSDYFQPQFQTPLSLRGEGIQEYAFVDGSESCASKTNRNACDDVAPTYPSQDTRPQDRPCVWIPNNISRCVPLKPCLATKEYDYDPESDTHNEYDQVSWRYPTVWTSLQFPNENQACVAANSRTATCGDGVCHRVRVWKCVAPFCDPDVDLDARDDVGKMKWIEAWESEEDSCPSDCGQGETSCFGPNAVRTPDAEYSADPQEESNGETGEQEPAVSANTASAREDSFVTDGRAVNLAYYDNGVSYSFSNSSSSVEFHELQVMMKEGVAGDDVLANWDGRFADGSSSSDLMWGSTTAGAERGRVGDGYGSPGPEFFDAGHSGMALLRHTCDGTMGINFGNGLGGSVQLHWLPSMVHMAGTLVEEIQSCRNAFNKVSQLSTQAFRDRWQLWTGDPLFKWFTAGSTGLEALDKTDPNMPDRGVSYILNALNPARQGDGSESGSASVRRTAVNAPSTCSYSTWKTMGMCRLKFTSLADLFNYENEKTPPREDVFVTVKRCSAPYDKALPAFGITLDGSQLTFSNPIRFCDGGASKCPEGKNLYCFNPETFVNLDDTFEDKRIEITPKGSLAPVDSNAYVYPRMSDPLALMIYGPRMGTSCSTRTRSVQKFIRDVVRGAALEPSDGLSSLDMCAPAMTKLLKSGDTDKLQDAMVRFVPEAFCRDGEDCDEVGQCTPRAKPTLCAQYESRPLMKVTSDMSIPFDSIAIRGLEATKESALSYQILDQISINEKKGTASLKADPGRAWLTSKVTVSKAFAASACSESGKMSIKREIVLKLKAKATNVWRGLALRHVHVVCDDASGRRRRGRRLAAAATAVQGTAGNHRTLSSTATELSILVQVPEDGNKANAIKSVATICDDTAVMAEVLADAGVRDSANQRPQASAIVSAEASTTTTETVTVSATELPKAVRGQVESANSDKLVDDNAAERDKKEEKDEDSGGLTVGMIVGIAVGCVALIGVVAGVAFLVISRKRSLSASSSRNNNKKCHQDVTNPVSGFEMAEPKTVMATTVVEAMPVPVAAPPPPQGGGVQPVGYQNGIPYYMGADGQTTWTQPKII